MTNFVTLIFLAILAQPAIASDWEHVGRTKEGDTVSMDRQSLLIFVGSGALAWFKYERGVGYDGKPKSWGTKVSANCWGGTVTLSAAVDYSRNGLRVTDPKMIGKTVDVAPDTNLDIVYQRLCKAMRQGS